MAMSATQDEYIAVANPYGEEIYKEQELVISAHTETGSLTRDGEITVAGTVTEIDGYYLFDAKFSTAIVQYHPTPLTLPDYAFSMSNYNREDEFLNDANADASLIINRDVIVKQNNVLSVEIFASSYITHLALPSTLTDITDLMFYNCSYLKDIQFITPSASYDNGLIPVVSGVVTLPNTIQSIGTQSFAYTDIDKLVIPSPAVQSASMSVSEEIVYGWTAQQTVSVPFASAEDRPNTWSENWKNSTAALIQYNGIARYIISFEASMQELIGLQFDNYSITVDAGDTLADIIDDVPVPTSTNYNFTGEWFKDAARTQEFLQTDEFDASITLYAGWIIKEFKITFEDSYCIEFKNTEGVVLSDDVNCEYGSSYQFLIFADNCFVSTPTIKANGTTLSPNGANIYSLSSITSDMDITIVGQKKTCTITLVHGNGTSNSTEVVEWHEELSSIQIPTKTESTFLGYFSSGDVRYYSQYGTGVGRCPTVTAITLTAKWEATKYTIFYSLAGGTNNPLNPEFYTASQTITLKAPTRNGYEFDGWYGSASINAPAITEISGTGIKFVYARWNVAEYSITYVIQIDEKSFTFCDTYTMQNSKTLLNINSLVGLGLTPGFTSVNTWYTNISLTGTKYSSLAAGNYGDKVFYGSATAIVFTLTLYINDNLYTSINYRAIDKVVLPTPSGYAGFVGWYIGWLAPARTVIEAFTIIGDHSVYAAFASSSSSGHEIEMTNDSINIDEQLTEGNSMDFETEFYVSEKEIFYNEVD